MFACPFPSMHHSLKNKQHFVLLRCLISFFLNKSLYLWHASSMSSVCGAFAMLDVHLICKNINLCSGCTAFKTSPALF